MRWRSVGRLLPANLNRTRAVVVTWARNRQPAQCDRANSPLLLQIYLPATPNKNRSITNIVRNNSFIACTTPKNVRPHYTRRLAGGQRRRRQFPPPASRNQVGRTMDCLGGYFRGPCEKVFSCLWTGGGGLSRDSGRGGVCQRAACQPRCRRLARIVRSFRYSGFAARLVCSHGSTSKS